MKQIKFLQEHCEFHDRFDCYVMLAVSRKKDTPEITNSQEIVFREVIKREEDIVRKYNKVKAMCQSYRDENGKSYPFYIYVSLNARDAKTATYLLMEKLMHWMHEETKGVDNSRMFKKVYGQFYSQLMVKSAKSKNTKYFMIDFDENDKVKLDHFITALKMGGFGEPVLSIKTRNGYHLKYKPFNRDKFERDKEFYMLDDFDFEVKYDSNFFVEYVKNKV